MKFSSFKKDQNIMESWRKYISEQEEEKDLEGEVEEDPPEVLDLGKDFDSGFCQYNPLINQFAQSSADGLAEMLIFVIATQQMRWYDVVGKFPLLMQFIKQQGGLLSPDMLVKKYDPKKKKHYMAYEFPPYIGQLVIGARKKAVDSVWRNRESYYSTFKPLFDKYKKAGSSTIEKEEAMFEIYLELMKVPSLGLPKAAFASQLIIGRLGCIDSINLNIYKGLDPDGKLITYDKKTGKPRFKTPTKKKQKDTQIITLTKGGVTLAKNYVEFLKTIAQLTKSTEARISQQLWDTWVEIVAKKINLDTDVIVKMPDGSEKIVPNDYSKKMVGKDPATKFRKKYIGKIKGKDVSRQHFPPEMNENIEMWNSYVHSLLEG